MSPSSIGKLVGLLICLGFSAFFSGSETALFSLSQLKLGKFLQDDNPSSRLIASSMENPRKILITILVGNMFVNILATSLAASLTLDLFGNQGLAISAGAMTFLLLIFGEITPKTLSVQNAEKISHAIIRPLSLFSRAITPLRMVLEKVTDFLISWIEGNIPSTRPILTPEELRTVVEVGYEEGVVDHREREMIRSIFDIGRATVSQVMTPRTEIFSLDSKTSANNARRFLKQRGYSRVPVYEGDEEKIIGVVYGKDLITLDPDDGNRPIKELLHSPHFVPDSKRVSDLLAEFRAKRVHLAMVIDEYGSLIGLVTMDDLLEEIMGEISTKDRRLYRFRDKNTVVCSATMELERFNHIFKTKLGGSGYRTIGGFLLHRLGKVPKVGETFRLNGLSFHILRSRPNRIEVVEVRRERR